ncbi:aldose 1-epimerase [Mangrovicella endophytica]|uniref:aldose 1-epimerase n=1 Tax=Mangrovicella endophytica TaxID=2066697 RepID=UPI000C9E51C2|nr:aldose 1-epimerase [Mangrovicella endophytica]
MTLISLAGDGFEARVSTEGGILTRLRWSGVPLLRDTPDDADALHAACYPLVPFGNRVRGNRFSFKGAEYRFEANTAWDPHYLHGEGWLGAWTVENADAKSAELVFRHAGSNGTPYRYEARQTFAVSDDGFEMQLAVTNRGEQPLPFGIGFHPHFPLTQETTLLAEAERFWTEAEGWLPGERAQTPEDLDFRTKRRLPERWVNNGFENWSGHAEIEWPERGTGLVIEAGPRLRHAFLFVSDTDFDPSYRRDYFCFEPMSHLADGHNMDDLGGLTVLAPGETIADFMRLRPSHL